MKKHQPWCTAHSPCHPTDFTDWGGMKPHPYVPGKNGACRATWFLSPCDWKKDDPRHTHKEAHS